jgi:hypothetical protein
LREYLLQATRLHEDIFDRSIDVQVLRLRRKLEAVNLKVAKALGIDLPPTLLVNADEVIE